LTEYLKSTIINEIICPRCVTTDGTAAIFIGPVNAYRGSANEQRRLYPNVATLGFRGHATQAAFNGDENAAVESAGGLKIAILPKILIIANIYTNLYSAPLKPK
jgi:hypothetical protein